MDDTVPEAGIFFDWVKMSKSMTESPPGWNGNLEEEADAEWCHGYLNQVIKATPLQGPASLPFFERLKEVDPSVASSSIDPRTMVEEGLEEGDDPILDFLNSPIQEQSNLDLSAPHAQVVDDFPSNNLNPPAATSEVLPRNAATGSIPSAPDST